MGSGNSGASGSNGMLPQQQQQQLKPRLIAANGLTDDQKQEQARKRAQVSSLHLILVRNHLNRFLACLIVICFGVCAQIANFDERSLGFIEILYGLRRK